MSQPAFQDPPDALRTEEVLNEVLFTPSDARDATIERLCAGDAVLQTEVKSLLRHLPDPEHPDHPTKSVAEIELEGKVIGGCRIERLLGRGGTGRVFRAMQEWPPRAVAVKVLRPELLGESARRRFRREARALARLDHPGIARILSAGLHRDGQLELPFVVMEIVEDARTLTEWWRTCDRPLAERLEAFACVCDAVHHGHVRGLVHRDLKPSNVLVDADGRARVIDFSVAAMTADDGSMMTLTRVIVGTPGYMAPEQFEGAEAADLRTDVHALGVLLFECLASKPAYAREGLSIAAAARVISGETVPSLAATDPSIDRDLDTIVSHAIAKSPDERYQSAAELAADIRRHCAGHPIVAQAASPMRRARLFARRNPVAAAAISVAALAVALGSMAAVAFGVREARSAARAEQALQEARRALWLAQLSEFGRAIETGDLAMINELRARLRSDPSWPARLLCSLSDESHAKLRGMELFEHFSPMDGVVAPDGSVLAIVMDRANGLALLDPRTLQIRRLLSPGFRSWSVAFDRVHGRLLSAEDRELLVWERPWVDPPRRIPLPFEYGTGIAASPDGTRVALTSQGNVCVVDISSGAVLARTNEVSGSTSRVAWSPDGALIAVGVEPRTVRLYRPDGLVEVARIAADSQRTLSLDFDPSGRWLAFAGDMRRLHVVEVSNPSNRRTIAFDYSIWGLRWHPDGRRIAVADRGSGVRIVQVPDDGSPLTLSGSFVGHDAEVWAVAWSPAGDRLYSIGQTEVHAWDEKPNGGPARHELGSPGLSLAHAADGSATALTADGSIWRVPASIDAGPERAWQGDAFLAFAACSDMPRDRHAWVSPEGRLRIAEPATGRVVERSHPVFADSVNVARFSPGGTRIALLGKSPKDPLLICNAVTGDEIARLSLEWTIQPAGLAWIDEDRLYAGSFGRAFEIRRHRDGAWKIVRPIEGAFMAVREATPDGHVLTASMSGQIIERDLADGHVVRTYGRVSDMVGCIALSADGSLIASSGTDRRLHLFDRASGEQLLALMGHERGRRVMAVDFSAGGDRVLTLDNAGGLVTWDTRPAASRPQDAPPAQ